jgi:hypothetical protein
MDFEIDLFQIKVENSKLNLIFNKMIKQIQGHLNFNQLILIMKNLFNRLFL